MSLRCFSVFHFNLSAASKYVIRLLCAKYRGTIAIDYKRKDSIEERTVVTMAHIERIWGTRSGHAAEIVENVVKYLKEHPANYQGQVGTLLELIYQTFTEYNSAETPEFRKQVDPLDETLRNLVETDEEADEYMNTVFSLCTTYERKRYIEGIKVGARLMMELMEE